MRCRRLAIFAVGALCALSTQVFAQVDPEPEPPPAAPEAKADETRPVAVHAGLGLGMPYGAFGLNAEALFGGYFALTGGVGHTVFAGVGYAVGGRVYLLPPRKGTRVRLTAIWGTAFIEGDTSDGGISTDNRQKPGLTVGLGGRSMFGRKKRHGVDYDVLYTVTPSADSVKEEWGTNQEMGIPIKISLGYTFGF